MGKSSVIKNGFVNLPALGKPNLLEKIKSAFLEAKAEILEIQNNPEDPTFANTILAIEEAGEDYSQLMEYLLAIRAVRNTKYIQKIFPEVMKVSASFDRILFSKKLFNRIETVYNQRKNLSGEDRVLTEELYKGYILGGAKLSPAKQKELNKINEKSGNLGNKYANNLQKEEEVTFLIVKDKAELKGLSDFYIKKAKDLARSKKIKGYALSFEASFYEEVLESSEVEETRKRYYTLGSNFGNQKNKYDNVKIAKQILELTQKKAKLLGYKNAVEMTLAHRMESNPKKIISVLNRIERISRVKTKKTFAKVKNKAKELGIEITPWNLTFLEESIRGEQSSFQFQDFFTLPDTIKTMFNFLGKTFSIKFTKVNHKSYHKDVVCYKVADKKTGSYLGMIHVDLFNRHGKDSGAWVNMFREPSRSNRPEAILATNFERRKNHKDVLLSLDDVKTLYHEMGHALHVVLSKASYCSLAGYNVSWDFVELPSQLLENFIADPKFLRGLTKHYKTGRKMNQKELNEAIKSPLFKSFEVNRQTVSSLLDLSIYTKIPKGDLKKYEDNFYKKYNLFNSKPIGMRLTSFDHIFGGGYGAGYYSYQWAEILDADAFGVFKRNKLAVAGKKFREEVLERGSTRPEMESYRAFMGRDPNIKEYFKRYNLHKK